MKPYEQEGDDQIKLDSVQIYLLLNLFLVGAALLLSYTDTGNGITASAVTFVVRCWQWFNSFMEAHVNIIGRILQGVMYALLAYALARRR